MTRNTQLVVSDKTLKVCVRLVLIYQATDFQCALYQKLGKPGNGLISKVVNHAFLIGLERLTYELNVVSNGQWTMAYSFLLIWTWCLCYKTNFGGNVDFS